jgi:hypothetical protein
LLGIVVLGACALPVGSATARADAASGTYTGTISLRGNYWWEKSTRVVAPSAAVTLASPSGVRVEGTYLIDAITSASQATGVSTDNAFTERRNDGSAGLGYEIDLGEQQLDVSVRARVSKEPDYFSRGAGFAAALSLDQRNTVLRLNGYFIHDDVYRINRFAPPEDPTKLMASKAERRGDLSVLSMGWAWDQVLGKQSTLTVGYDLAVLDGFQSNAYRMVPLAGGGARQETHPEQRTRHAPYVWLSHFALSTRTAFRFGYRLYRDNWDVTAHTPDFRIHQELGSYVELRLRYRYFRQSESYFNGEMDGPYITADPKMVKFHDHSLGLKTRVALEFLAFTPLRALQTAVVDWSFEYVFSSNPYNNNDYYDGFLAQGGVLWPF